MRGDPVEAGEEHDPPINKAAETLYKITHLDAGNYGTVPRDGFVQMRGDPVDAGEERDPPINKAAEHLYRVTNLDADNYIIPVAE